MTIEHEEEEAQDMMSNFRNNKTFKNNLEESEVQEDSEDGNELRKQIL